jgi:hypothetical protein
MALQNHGDKSNMKKIKLIIFFILINFSRIVFSKEDPSNNVQIKIEPRESSGQAITVSFQFDSKESTPPDLSLKSIEDKSQSWNISAPQILKKTQTFLINGKSARKSSSLLKLTLVPLKIGQLKTPKIKILVSNKTFNIDEASINVKTLRPKQQSPQTQVMPSPRLPFFNLFELDEEKPYNRIEPENKNKQLDVFVVAEPSKTQVFVGELITLPFYIYTNENIFRNLEFGSFPTFKDFLKEQLFIPKSWRPERTEYRNNNYFKAEIIRFALFPIKTGELLIDPLKMRFEVDTDIFQMLEQMQNPQQMLGHNQLFTKTSGSIPITVLPLPPKPASITQNNIPVGNYKISLEHPNQKLVQNEAFNLKLRIEGRGNIKGLQEPELKLPPTLQKSRTATNYETNDRSEGFKDFEVLIVPQNSGDFKIAANSWSYFDPDKKLYETIPIPSLELHIEPSSKTFTEEKKDKRLIFSGTQEFIALEKTYFSIYVWIIPAALYALASLFFIQRKKREEEDRILQNFPWIFIEKKILKQPDLNSIKLLGYIEEWIILRFAKLSQKEASFDELMATLVNVCHVSTHPKIKKLRELFKRLEEKRFGFQKSSLDSNISFQEIKKLSEEIIQSLEFSSSANSSKSEEE